MPEKGEQTAQSCAIAWVWSTTSWAGSHADPKGVDLTLDEFLLDGHGGPPNVPSLFRRVSRAALRDPKSLRMSRYPVKAENGNVSTSTSAHGP
jgi:hypothetical protein